MGLYSKVKNVNSLMEIKNYHEALRIYTGSKSCYFKDKDYLGTFIDGLAQIASHRFEQNRFNCDSFLCCHCNEIIRNPVTLKCGHSFSKECILEHANEARNYSFKCPRCHNTYTHSYISTLKKNVTIFYMVEKLLDRIKIHKADKDKTDRNKKREARKFVRRCKEEIFSKDSTLHSFQETSSLGFYKKGYILFSFKRYEEAFKALLTSLTLDYEAQFAKLIGIKVFKRLLQKRNAIVQTHPLRSSLLRQSFINLRTSGGTSGNNNSLHEDDISSSDEDNSTSKEIEYPERKDLHMLIDSFFEDIKNLGVERSLLFRTDAASYLDKKEFECPLCIRMLWDPVTTTCGHTFCKVCIRKSLYHQPRCPLCKSSLLMFIAECMQNLCTTEFLELAIRNLFPTEYAERKAIHLEEIEDISK